MLFIKVVSNDFFLGFSYPPNMTNLFNSCFGFFFMIEKESGFANYILGILVVAFVMAGLLFFVLDVVYGEDPEGCKFVDFDVSGMCREGKTANFVFANKGSFVLDVEIDGKREDGYSFGIGESRRMKVVISDKNMDFVPLVRVAGGFEECRGKVKKYNTEVLVKC